MLKTDESLGEAPANPYRDNELRPWPTGKSERLLKLAPLFKVGERPSDEVLELLHEKMRPGKGLVFAGWKSNVPVWRLPPGEAAKTQAEASANRQAALAAGHVRYRGQLCSKPEHASWQGERNTCDRMCYGCAQERFRKRTKKGGSWYEYSRKLCHAAGRRNRQTTGHPTQVAYALRKLSYGAFQRLGIEKDRNTESLFGCTFGDMYQFLLIQLEVLGLRWEDQGDTWVCDHIRPVSDHIGKPEPERALLWWNAQPLSPLENAAKGDRLDWQPSARQRRAYNKAARWMLKRGYAPPPDGANCYWPIGGTDGREP